MMSNFYDEARKRDEEFIKGLCGDARHLRMELREWIQEELRALITEADLLESQADGIIREQIARTLEQLRIINHTDLNEANDAYNDAVNEVAEGGYDNVYEAYNTLQKESSQLIQIMKELLDKRRFIGEM